MRQIDDEAITPWTRIKGTAIWAAVVALALVIGWFTFKIVYHIVAALLTGIIVLGIALFIYFKFFRRTGDPNVSVRRS
jgi:cobalamin biosynthesis protein CobD/CbiB